MTEQNQQLDPQPEEVVLYVNTEYGNEVTIGTLISDEINSFGCMTWRELIEDVLGDDLSSHAGEEDWLEGEYGITADELDCDLDSGAVEKYYSSISFHTDNFTGGEVEAFGLIRSLKLFPMDKDGNGHSNGVELTQTYANGPKKCVYIADQAAADWLVKECQSRGVNLKVKFV
jgi:hypothetical protein